jgi:hypothetical protein
MERIHDVSHHTPARQPGRVSAIHETLNSFLDVFIGKMSKVGFGCHAQTLTFYGKENGLALMIRWVKPKVISSQFSPKIRFSDRVVAAHRGADAGDNTSSSDARLHSMIVAPTCCFEAGEPLAGVPPVPPSTACTIGDPVSGQARSLRPAVSRPFPDEQAVHSGCIQ